MVIFLELSDVGADGTRLERGAWWYTCRHLQPNGDCAIYARRPRMCSGFPYGARCLYRECTWDAARAGCFPLRVVDAG